MSGVNSDIAWSVHSGIGSPLTVRLVAHVDFLETAVLAGNARSTAYKYKLNS